MDVRGDNPRRYHSKAALAEPDFWDHHTREDVKKPVAARQRITWNGAISIARLASPIKNTGDCGMVARSKLSTSILSIERLEI